MKKSLLAMGLSMAFASTSVFSLPLKVNGVVIDDISVDSFSFTGGTLTLNTTGATLGVVDGGGNDGGGNDGGGNDGGGNDGGGNDGGGCTDTSTISCASTLSWAVGERSVPVTIPKGKTLVSPFTTTGVSNYYGEISFQHRPPQPTVEYWISKTPGGPAISGRRCSGSGYHLYSLSWTQGNHAGYCALAKNEKYYFNIKHLSSSQAASVADRTRTFRP